jgi:hypothetical protein
MIDRFQDGRCRHVGTSSTCYEMGNYHRTLMKIGTQTKQNMLIECKNHKCGSLRQKKQQKLNVKNDIVLKRQRCMSAKL